jgi:translation initiation factor eIF-2B subunit alpha
MKEIILPENVKVDNPPCDYTPAKFITLLFTDLGVLTPSAVSDELIRLYQ